MKVVIGCEFSGVVGQAFQDVGCDVTTSDLLPSENPNVRHYQGDIFELLKKERFDLGIFHPPCFRICNSGVMWLEKRNLWDEMKKACLFFKALLEADIDKIAVENPIPHKYALKIIGKKYNQIIQPYMFGHPERKATCLWLKNLPELKPTKDVKKRMESLPKKEAQRIYYTSPGKDRWKIRSRTFKGIAQAMASQWGVGKANQNAD